ncbi:uncharacterized protein LOC112089737 [Eutrema salsugineum]|uniref:uncharacterized protein LOC112089737 n=1 Tax=Eutrema salsugineum TaxID=72664 RepID=UPI000CED10FD|nr:uncharacterized protein LOC112089737 [Eutrema salsugineum]
MEYKANFNSKETMEQIRIQNPTWDHYPGIWYSGATPKFTFVTWLSAKNRLSTGDRMERWNCNAHTGCSFCSEPKETRDHLFFLCPFTKEIWNNLVGGTRKQSFTVVWEEIMIWIIKPPYDNITTFLLRYTLHTAIYHIWCERNNRRHKETPVDQKRLKKMIDVTVKNRISSLRELGRKKYGEGLTTWFATRTT